MRVFKAFLALLLVLTAVSCNDATPVVPSDGTQTTTEYTDPFAPEDGGIGTESYTAGQVLDYFTEIAFGSEYGKSSERLCRWEKEIRYTITGEPTDADTKLVEYLVNKLNSVKGFPGMKKAASADDANFEIMFVPRSTIIEEFENATESCVGMSEYHWVTDTFEITAARAAIDVAATDERNSTICEEVLQAMGLAMDSYSHRDSVFYQGKCVYNRPSELDFAMVEILYHPSLRTGMSRYEAIIKASGILKW